MVGRHIIRIWNFLECRPTTNRHNKLSAEGRTMIEERSTDYSTTVGHRHRKYYILTQRTQNWSSKKEVYIGQENGCWTADCCPDNPFFPKKPTVVRRFLKMDWVFRLQSQLYWFFCHLSYMYIVVLSFLPQNTGVIDTNSSAYVSYGFSHYSNVYVNLTWPVKIRIRNSVKKYLNVNKTILHFSYLNRKLNANGAVPDNCTSVKVAHFAPA